MSLINSYLFTVTLGATLLGILAGLVGTFSYVRGENLLGDALSHAALPGLALSFLLLKMKSAPILLSGAALSGLVAMGMIIVIINKSKLKLDTALALVLSVFFGLGFVLMGIIQRHFGQEQAGLESYIFGQAAAFLKSDLWIVIISSIFIITMILLFYKEFKLFSFDPEYMDTLGLPVRKIQLLLNFLLVLTIIIELQTVGVILMSAMLISPSAAARLWTHKLDVLLITSGILGGVSACVGTLISVHQQLPTGPAIVLVLSLVILISLIFSPKGGWLARRKKDRKVAEEVIKRSLLSHIDSLKNKEGWTTRGEILAHKKYHSMSERELDHWIHLLVEEGFIVDTKEGLALVERGAQ